MTMENETLEQPELEPVAGTRSTILVVEDELDQLEVLSQHLRRQGFDVRTANCGESALESAREEQPDLVLLDIGLPGVDGLTVCQRIVDDPVTADVPVILLSGSDKPGIIRDARVAGCRFFLEKPYDPNALLALIERAIEADLEI